MSGDWGSLKVGTIGELGQAFSITSNGGDSQAIKGGSSSASHSRSESVGRLAMSSTAATPGVASNRESRGISGERDGGKGRRRSSGGRPLSLNRLVVQQMQLRALCDKRNSIDDEGRLLDPLDSDISLKGLQEAANGVSVPVHEDDHRDEQRNGSMMEGGASNGKTVSLHILTGPLDSPVGASSREARGARGAQGATLTQRKGRKRQSQKKPTTIEKKVGVARQQLGNEQWRVYRRGGPSITAVGPFIVYQRYADERVCSLYNEYYDPVSGEQKRGCCAGCGTSCRLFVYRNRCSGRRVAVKRGVWTRPMDRTSALFTSHIIMFVRRLIDMRQTLMSRRTLLIDIKD